MSAPFTLSDLHIQTGYLEPETLATLKRVFDTACREGDLSVEAKCERTDLAKKLLTAIATIAPTIEYESLLLAFARRAMADYRPIPK